MNSYIVIARRVALTVSASLLSVACYSWNHAPGHTTRAKIVKHELRVVTGSFCHFGACDKKASSGHFRFSNVQFEAYNEARVRTSFDVVVEGARARCNMPSNPSQVFACSLSEESGTSYALALSPGCTDGWLSTTGDSEGPRTWTIQTDKVVVAGRTFPRREVSFLDEEGVVATSDAVGSDNLDVFTRRGAAVPDSLILLAVVSVQAFLQLDDLPSECIVAT